MKYPIGIQTFEKIIEGDFVYVDKTSLIYNLVHGGQYFFLSRPRRFGKSLLLSTIEAYFSGKKELFKGLDIYKLETDWPINPVIHFDLNIGEYDSADDLRQRLGVILSGYENLYGRNPVEESVSDRFEGIIKRANELTGQKVVILIDEYDKPVLNAINDTTLQDTLRKIMRSFYAALKSCDRHIRFAMLTGVTRFGKLSVFSELNNINDISFSPMYASICGVTETELLSHFDGAITSLAQAQGSEFKEMIDRLREMYDGYRFSSAPVLVYNPFSLLMAFDHCEIDSYWFHTGTPKYLVDLLRSHHYILSDLEGSISDRQRLGSFDPDSSDPIPVIYQSGYLTIRDFIPQRNRFVLGYPNEEVRQGFMEYLWPFYAPTRDKKLFDVDKFINDIECGDAASFMERLKSLTADISYEILANCEDDFQNLLYIIFTLSSIKPVVERRTSDGRIDMVVETERFVYVMEFKVNGSSQQAIDQINDNSYTLPWNKEDRKVIKIGANFSTEKRRLTDYAIEVGEY